MTVVSAVGVLGGAAAEVPSGGTSTFLVIVAWTGMITSGIQCINGLVRVGAIIANPDDNTLQRWDSNKIYSTSILIVDALGMAAAIASLPSGIKNLWAIIVRQRAFALRGLTETTLRNMNAAERAKVIRELIEAASKTPEGRAAIMAAAREADIAASTLARSSSLSVRNATKMVEIISEETARRVHSALREIVSVPVQGVVSGLPFEWVGSANGSVNWIIHLVDTGTGS